MRILSFLTTFNRALNPNVSNPGPKSNPVEKVDLNGQVTPFGQLIAVPSLPYVPGQTDCRERFKRILVSEMGTEFVQSNQAQLENLLETKYKDEDVYRGCSRVSGKVAIDQIHLGTLELKPQPEMYVLFAGLKVQYRKQPHPADSERFVSIKSVLADKTYFADYAFDDIGGWLPDRKMAAALMKELYWAEKEVERSTRELKEQTKALLLLGSESVDGLGVVSIRNDQPLPIEVFEGKIYGTLLVDISSSQEVELGYVIGMPAIEKKRVAVEEESDYDYGGRDWFEKIVYWPKDAKMPSKSDTVMEAVFRILQGAYPDDFSSNGCSAKSRNVKVNALSFDLVMPIEEPYLGTEIVVPGGVIQGFFALIAEGKVMDADNHQLPEDEWTADKIDHVVAKKIWISNQIIDDKMAWMSDGDLKEQVKKQDKLMSKLCAVLEKKPKPPLLGWLGNN
jgi:hypothetical protein